MTMSSGDKQRAFREARESHEWMSNESRERNQALVTRMEARSRELAAWVPDRKSSAAEELRVVRDQAVNDLSTGLRKAAEVRRMFAASLKGKAKQSLEEWHLDAVLQATQRLEFFAEKLRKCREAALRRQEFFDELRRQVPEPVPRGGGE